MALGLWMLYEIPNAATKHGTLRRLGVPLSKWFDPDLIGLDAETAMYVGFVAVLVNVLVAVVVTLILRAMKTPDGVDITTRDDYFADEGDPRVGPPTVDELAGARS
jgi:SSS family solute:Na+ symporter